MARPNESESEIPRLPAGTRVACVASTYHEGVVGPMVASARATLEAAGASKIVDHDAPGAFELPLIAQRLARRGDLHAVLAFGLVLKGETDHDRHISRAVSGALMRVALEADKPVLFGLLTCPTLEHALRRSQPRAEGGLDKGHEVALAAIRTLNTLQEIG